MTIEVFDFFSGCGGTSSGLKAAGFNIKFALDNDSIATETFRRNFPNANVITSAIENFHPSELEKFIGLRSNPILFCGCAPCQPFSRQNNRKSQNDPRRNLLTEFANFVDYWIPEFVLIENVPGLQKVDKTGPLQCILNVLNKKNYKYQIGILPACDFGVPQRRERLVLVASIIGEITLPTPSHGPGRSKPFSNVREWIYELPKIIAGETHKLDPDHRAAKLSDINLNRIKHTPEGGGRESWPEQLRLECHKKYTGHTDVYGRLHWDKLASGLTTRCISYSNGRFGHPEQHRALSVREAACLQTFPKDYVFTGNLAEKARQIGNAVPPLLSKSIAEQIMLHYKNHIIG